jgi:hypothetical protein
MAAVPGACSFRATYTLDGHKKLAKNRKWLDGFVSQRGRDAKLYDEAGAVVGLGRLAEGEVLEEGAEVSKGFGQSILISVDVPCAASEISAAGDGGGEPAAAVAPTAAAPALPAAAGQSGRAVRPAAGAVPQLGGGGGKRPAFKAPRPVAAAASAAAAGSPQREAAALPPQRRQFMPLPPRLPAQAPSMQQPSPAALAPAPAAPTPAVRSGMLRPQCFCHCMQPAALPNPTHCNAIQHPAPSTQHPLAILPAMQTTTSCGC